ncbi:MAG: hypothetical protein HY927_07145 [Elusimicrobia bacterium]|nr:hypothetical protein [Elusimicrobiota bacterium]
MPTNGAHGPSAEAAARIAVVLAATLSCCLYAGWADDVKIPPPGPPPEAPMPRPQDAWEGNTGAPDPLGELERAEAERARKKAEEEAKLADEERRRAEEERKMGGDQKMRPVEERTSDDLPEERPTDLNRDDPGSRDGAGLDGSSDGGSLSSSGKGPGGKGEKGRGGSVGRSNAAMGKALGTAQRLAGQLNSGMLKGDAFSGAGKGDALPSEGRQGLREAAAEKGLEAASAVGSPRTGMGGFDPGRPRTRGEMAMAASMGFKGSFARQGLAVRTGPDGRPAIVDRDGRPATEAQLELLRKDIASQPAALTRYPEFFSEVSPAQFQGLKERYNASPESRDKEFKDMALTEGDRDFQWGRSCEKVSGECNPHAQEGSYSKGEFVPPEDLGSVWDELDKEEKAIEDSMRKDAQGRMAGSLGSARAAGLLGRVRSAIDGWLGGDEGGQEEGPDAGVGVQGGRPSVGAAVKGSGGGRVGLAGGKASGGSPSAGAAKKGRLGAKAALWLAAIAAAGGLILAGLRRGSGRPEDLGSQE